MYGAVEDDHDHERENLPPSGPSTKRQRVATPLNDLITLLERYSCSGLRPAQAPGSSGSGALSPPPAAPAEGLRVEDPRSLRRKLEAALAPQQAQDAFVAGLAEVVADDHMLRQALLPMVVTSQTNYANGDSLLRLALNLQRVQARVAGMLLEKLPEYCGDAADGAGAIDHGRPAEGTSTPSLILGQLRWLDAADDAGGLTDKVLQVLPVCTPSVQQQLIGFLPEVALPEEHERVVEVLMGLLEQDPVYVPSVMGAISDMQLEPELQDHAVSCLAQQLAAAERWDLPALIGFLVANATPQSAQDMAATVRGCLNCVVPRDPRDLVANDEKQKGPADGGRGVVLEALVLRHLGAALQGGDAAPGGFLKAISAVTEPRHHKPIDFWVLLLIWQHGGAPGATGAGFGGAAAAGSATQHARSALAMLRRKILEKQAGARWIEGAIKGHQTVAVDLWQPLSALAAAWSRAKEVQLRAAAGHLYRWLFVAVESTAHRQEVLQALHGHLGSGQQLEEDVALEVLLLLARRQTSLLSRFGAFLASILDHLECFSDAQLRQVFEMFAALTGGGSAAGSSGAAGGRFEDELHITLTKALAHTSPVYKRIGIVGNLAMLRREAAAYAAAAEERGPGDPDELLKAWTARAESLLRQCQPAPGCMAFLLDRLADAVLAGVPVLQDQAPAGANAEGAAAAAGGRQQRAAPGGEASAPLPRPLAQWLSDRVQDMLYDGGSFLADINQGSSGDDGSGSIDATFAPGAVATGDPHLRPAVWFNLDGPSAMVALKVLPIAASADPRERAKLAWLGPLLRLLVAVTLQLENGLSTIDALLGCPIVLFEPSLATDGSAWASLPGPSRLAALGALFHTVAWLRETVNGFAPQIGACDMNMATQPGDGDDTRLQQLAELQAKVLARLMQLHQLELLLQQLAATGSAASQLPDLARPLAAAVLPGAAAAAAAGAAGGAAVGKDDKVHAGSKPDDVMRKLRCLELQALQALHAAPSIQAQLSVLLPAAHLAADLHAKLKAVLGKARRPAFAAAGAATQLDPCLESLSPSDLMEQLEPLLPALQQHLALAVATIKEPPEGAGEELLTTGLPGFDDPASKALLSYDCTRTPFDTASTARALALSCLRTFALLLSPTAVAAAAAGASAGSQQAGAAALKALAPAAAAGASGSEGLPKVRLAAAAFDAVAQLSCLASGYSDLELEMALLELQASAVATAADAGATRGTPAAAAALKLRKKLSRGAEALLKQTWGGGADEAEEEGKGFCWKGHNPAIARLLALWVGNAPDPSTVLLDLAGRLFQQVPGGKVAAKEQLAAIEGYPALCVATFPTWYRVVFEQVVALSEQLAAEAIGFISAKQGGDGGTAAAGGGGRGGGKAKKAAAAAAAAQQLALCSSEEVDAVVERYQRATHGFAALVELSKAHQGRVGLLGQAIKLGARHIDLLLSTLPFWRAAYEDRGAALVALIRDTQRGTKLMQNICNEAKAKRSTPLLSKAPAAKRSLERFVYEVRALFHEMGLREAVWIGNLKNRDLGGAVVGSQMYVEEDDDEEEEYAEEGDEDAPMEEEVEADEGEGEGEGDE